MTGSALGQLGMTAMALFAIIGVLRSRNQRQKTDEDAEARLARQLEMERRMASYLAGREDR